MLDKQFGARTIDHSVIIQPDMDGKMHWEVEVRERRGESVL